MGLFFCLFSIPSPSNQLSVLFVNYQQIYLFPLAIWHWKNYCQHPILLICLFFPSAFSLVPPASGLYLLPSTPCPLDPFPLTFYLQPPVFIFYPWNLGPLTPWNIGPLTPWNLETFPLIFFLSFHLLPAYLDHFSSLIRDPITLINAQAGQGKDWVIGA